MRSQLDGLGATGTRIIATNDLDEFAIEALASAPLDSYGVGTSVVTGSGAPAAGFVYKLAAHLDDDGTWMPVGKRSAEKATVAGRKQPVRALRAGVASAEHIYVEEPAAEGVGRELLVDLVVDGEAAGWALGPEGVLAARIHHAAAIAQLPPDALALSPGDAAIPTVYF